MHRGMQLNDNMEHCFACRLTVCDPGECSALKLGNLAGLLRSVFWPQQPICFVWARILISPARCPAALTQLRPCSTA
jgi:hypothetical protein